MMSLTFIWSTARFTVFAPRADAEARIVARRIKEHEETRGKNCETYFPKQNSLFPIFGVVLL
jgi:hypothetical protein